jgi:Arc/MetJ-type ribon-helix-helix transcriptional regulator
MITIHLPQDLESSLKAEVRNGRFASETEAVTAIVRDYFEGKRPPSPAELDEIVPDSRNGEQDWSSPGKPADHPDRKPIWERLDELRKSVPAEEWDKLPVDGAEQLDHYIYGSPKRPTS